MKLFFVIFSLIVAASGQVADTTTEELLLAQSELSLGHEFAESQLKLNRNIISSYITIVNMQLLDSFMTSYAEIQTIADDTTSILEGLTTNDCVRTVRERWDLQVTRFGQRLSECLRESFREISRWNDYVNTIHQTAHSTTNQVQNAGVAELSDREEIVGRDSLYRHINNRFRDLLSAAVPYMDQFENFRASVVDNEEEVISDLTLCDRELTLAVVEEAREDVSRAQAC